MQIYNLFMEVQGEKIIVGTVPEANIPVEGEDVLLFVKNVFVKRIQKENPLIIKDVLLTILETFIKKDKLEDIVKTKEILSSDNKPEIAYYFQLSDKFKTDEIFTVPKDLNPSIKEAIHSFIEQLIEGGDKLAMILSLAVFSGLSNEEFNKNMEDAVPKAFFNFIELLEVELIDE